MYSFIIESIRPNTTAEQFEDLLVKVKAKVQRAVADLTQLAQEARRTSANAEFGLVGLLEKCDIDQQSISWIAQNYTKESTAKQEDDNETSESTEKEIKPVIVSPKESSSLQSYLIVDMGALKSWNWDILSFEPNDLIPAVIQIFNHFNFFEVFRVPPEAFVRFVQQVKKGCKS